MLIDTRGAGGQAELPGPELLARLLQHPLAERHDEAGVLGEGDERVGGEPAPLRVVPAHQRLDAGDAAGLERHDGLVDEAQLAGLDAAGQVGLQLEPLEGARVHLLLEQLDAVLALLLGQVHGHVGVAQHAPRPRSPGR